MDEFTTKICDEQWQVQKDYELIQVGDRVRNEKIQSLQVSKQTKKPMNSKPKPVELPETSCQTRLDWYPKFGYIGADGQERVFTSKGH